MILDYKRVRDRVSFFFMIEWGGLVFIWVLNIFLVREGKACEIVVYDVIRGGILVRKVIR